MLSGNLVIAFFVTQYIRYAISLANPKNKKGVRRTNTRLDTLRKKPYLTMKEQKEFISLRHNTKAQKHKKINWKGFFLSMLMYLPIFLGLYYGLRFIGLTPPFWITLITCTVLSVIINKILRKFGIERQNSIETLLR